MFVNYLKTKQKRFTLTDKAFLKFFILVQLLRRGYRGLRLAFCVNKARSRYRLYIYRKARYFLALTLHLTEFFCWRVLGLAGNGRCPFV